jgi:RNA polymerase sigma factor (sigma-70 family)
LCSSTRHGTRPPWTRCKLYGFLSGHQHVARNSGREILDILSYAYEGLRKVARSFDLDQDSSKFAIMLNATVRNLAIDVFRGDSGVVHKPRRVYRKQAEAGTLVHGEIHSLSDDVTAAEVEHLGVNRTGVHGAAEAAYLRVWLRREFERLLRTVPQGRHRVVLVEHLLGGLTQREVQDLMVKEGFPKVTASRMSQILRDLLDDLRGKRKEIYSGKRGKKRG